MDRTKLLKPLIFLMFFIYFADLLEPRVGLYYAQWWFDIPMHFLGGFWVGLFFLWFFSQAKMPFLRRPITDLNKKSVIYALIFVMFVGMAWEALEVFSINLLGQEPFITSDTIYDLILDFIGGLAAIFYCKRIIMPRSFNNV